MQDINKLLPKQYPEHFHNKIFLCCTEIWHRSSNSLATISVFLPVTLCLWLLKYEVPNRLPDGGKKVSHVLSNVPVTLELATKNSVSVPSYNLLVQQHVLNLQDGYFLPDLHKIPELSRAIYLFSDKYHTIYIVVVCTWWQRWENYCKSLALKKK